MIICLINNLKQNISKLYSKLISNNNYEEVFTKEFNYNKPKEINKLLISINDNIIKLMYGIVITCIFVENFYHQFLFLCKSIDKLLTYISNYIQFFDSNVFKINNKKFEIIINFSMSNLSTLSYLYSLMLILFIKNKYVGNLLEKVELLNKQLDILLKYKYTEYNIII